jgi:transposase InsO family protein
LTTQDNALAESTLGLYKTELVRQRGPWRGIDDLEIATLEYIDWLNNRRLHGACGDIPPAEFEALHYHATGQQRLPLPTNQASTEPRAVQKPAKVFV